jgi:hypothetical protein
MMQMTRALAVGWVLVAACGPSDAGAPSGAPATATPSSTATASARPSAPPPFDLAGYCRDVCQRATTCGLEAAAALAQKGNAQDAAALTSAKAAAPDVEKKCLDQCNASKVDDARDKADAARACLAEKECAGFAKCLETAAR